MNHSAGEQCYLHCHYLYSSIKFLNYHVETLTRHSVIIQLTEISTASGFSLCGQVHSDQVPQSPLSRFLEFCLPLRPGERCPETGKTPKMGGFSWDVWGRCDTLRMRSRELCIVSEVKGARGPQWEGQRRLGLRNPADP